MAKQSNNPVQMPKKKQIFFYPFCYFFLPIYFFLNLLQTQSIITPKDKKVKFRQSLPARQCQLSYHLEYYYLIYFKICSNIKKAWQAGELQTIRNYEFPLYGKVGIRNEE